MTSKVTIANMALGHVGSSTTVSSLDPPDGSVEASRCAMFFDISRRSLIEATSPSWARARVQLAQAVSNPSNVWSYAYVRPSDCIKPLRIVPSYIVHLSSPLAHPTSSADSLNPVSDIIRGLNESASADYEQEGGLLLTHEPDAVLIYIKDVDNPPVASPLWNLAHSYALASMIAGGTIKGRPGAQAARQFFELATSYARQASASDANANSQRHAVAAGWMSARQ
jgi:hypothetical protein